MTPAQPGMKKLPLPRWSLGAVGVDAEVSKPAMEIVDSPQITRARCGGKKPLDILARGSHHLGQ
ncbi:MAG: hypothetical protein KDB26_08780, partial [Microthrixaceae bacterium]|nr:hypothetical protein [Microthrixaceae bacterium]